MPEFDTSQGMDFDKMLQQMQSESSGMTAPHPSNDGKQGGANTAPSSQPAKQNTPSTSNTSEETPLTQPRELGLDGEIDITPTFDEDEEDTGSPQKQETATPAQPAAPQLDPALFAQFQAFMQQQEQQQQAQQPPAQDSEDKKNKNTSQKKKKQPSSQSTVTPPHLADNTAHTGIRGALAKLGLHVSKSRTEQQHDQWLHTLQEGFEHCKIIGVGSFKGGVGKTTEASALAATIAAHNPSAKVAAVDLDPTGTLKTRAMDNQKIDIAGLADNIAHGARKFSALASKTRDGVDIFGSRKNVTDPEPTGEQVRTILTAFREYYDFVIVDLPVYSSTDSYLESLHHMDALMYVTVNSEETITQMSGFTQMLGYNKVDNLAGRSVVVFNTPPINAVKTDDESMVTLADKMQNEGISVLETPFDPALQDTHDLMLSSLRKGTYWKYVQMAAMVFDLLEDTN